MEKLIYTLWKPETRAAEDFNASLLGPVRERLAGLGVERLQVNVRDAAVAGSKLELTMMRPSFDGMVCFWVNSANARKQVEDVLEAAAPRIAGYAVAESVIKGIGDRQKDGERTRGFSQLAFLHKLPGITYEGFLEIWMRDQSIVGAETQSTFFYSQNIVTRHLTVGAPEWDGIVEECFPIEALTDPLVYWDADGKQEKYQANYQREMNNVARFLDSRVHVIITSQYRYGGWNDPPV